MNKMEVDIIKETMVSYYGGANHYRVVIPADISDLIEVSRGDRIRWSLKNGKLKITYIKKLREKGGEK